MITSRQLAMLLRSLDEPKSSDHLRSCDASVLAAMIGSITRHESGLEHLQHCIIPYNESLPAAPVAWRLVDNLAAISRGLRRSVLPQRVDAGTTHA
jgi:hypothetical protein